MIGKRVKINGPKKIPVTPKEMDSILEEGIRRVEVPKAEYRLGNKIGFLEYENTGKENRFTGKEILAIIKEVHNTLEKTEVTFRIQAVIKEKVGKPASY